MPGGGVEHQSDEVEEMADILQRELSSFLTLPGYFRRVAGVQQHSAQQIFVDRG